MKYALTRTIVAGQEAMVVRYGDMVWEAICDTWPDGDFTVLAVAGLAPLRHLAHSTRRDVARVVIANVQAEYIDRPGECPFIRVGNTYRMR